MTTSLPRRKLIRLPEYDYSQVGSYFVTVVTKDRKNLFGNITNNEMVLNELGKIVDLTWHELVKHVPNIELDEFVIMPNHIHGIIHVVVGAGSKPARFNQNDSNENAEKSQSAPVKTYSLSEIVRQFKTFSAKRINQQRGTPGIPVWQRNYYEHIIGTDREFDQIAEYIFNNPINWEMDDERPE